MDLLSAPGARRRGALARIVGRYSDAHAHVHVHHCMCICICIPRPAHASVERSGCGTTETLLTLLKSITGHPRGTTLELASCGCSSLGMYPHLPPAFSSGDVRAGTPTLLLFLSSPCTPHTVTEPRSGRP
eukprot:scaffold7386_cov71-Phaeocystis_antarctica.AAC.5